MSKVEFFQGATLIATINAPNLFTFTVNNLAAGNYSFTARATDNLGAQTTSSAATVTVSTNLPPSVNLTAPAAQSVYAAPANITITGTAGDTDGTVTQIQLFANGSPIATLPGTSPFSFNWTNVAAGSYALTARAIDNTNAATTSGSVNVTVNPNQPPSVTLTSPTNNASFAAPATITLTATAADTDGTIASVQLLNGAGVVATLASPPYTSTLTNVTAGSYTFTAKATDNNGAITTSAAANVTVTGVTATAVYYIYTDQLNTPRAITNEAATPVWKWDNTDPFGANAANEDPDGDTNKFVFNLRFPGQYLDKETNTHYNYYRDYDPSIGRYIQSDPIGLDGGINTYSYVNANPLSDVDPTGEVGIAGAGYGAIAGAVSGYISSGGKWQGAVLGGIAGGAIGWVNPWSSSLVGAAAGGFIASAVGQAGGNYLACRPIPDIDWTLAAISGVGSGSGLAFGKALDSPTRNAFSYMVNQRMGPGNQAALKTLQSFVKGGTSGAPQLAYKALAYPANYPQNYCGCP